MEKRYGMSSKIEVLICYAHKDEPLMRELECQLRVLEQQGLITIWHDRMIVGGTDWKQEMNKHLNSARIILFLVSADFIASETNTDEIEQAMKRHATGKAQVIPVILKHVLWRGSVFGKLKPLPTDGKPVTGAAWHSHDEAFIDVAEGVQQAVEELNRPTTIPISTQNSLEAEQPLPVKKQQRRPATEFDVFLCHNNADKAEVKKIAQELKSRGIKPWLDEWELRPGYPWQRALEAQIGSIKSAAVFVGKSGIGPWQNMELEALLDEFVRRGCPVIPVVLADAPDKPALPLFLRNMAWVDFRKQEPVPIEQLIWGITGEYEGRD
jgi:TIR domain